MAKVLYCQGKGIFSDFFTKVLFFISFLYISFKIFIVTRL